MDSLILMGESLCCADTCVSLHLTVPEAPERVHAWAERRPRVILSTERPDRLTGWDVKPWLLLQELNAGNPEALWLDTDMIVTRSVSRLLDQFPRDVLIVAEEWDRHPPIPVAHLWGWTSVRPVRPVNSCFVRVTAAHRPLLERWVEMTCDPRYREAQTLPFEKRPFHLAGDQPLLTALLESEEFGTVPFAALRAGRHIAQCAGSSGYRPGDRILDLFRGLPPLIHCIGRKPWAPVPDQGRMQRFLIDLATDVSPYVLAARKVARDLEITPGWLSPRTAPGAMLRKLTSCHPGMAGLPIAIAHGLHMQFRHFR